MRSFVLCVTTLFLITGCNNTTGVTGENQLSLPDLIDTNDGKQVELVLKHGKHEFYSGVKSQTMGFNGSYLGPTIRLHKDTKVRIGFTNDIGENTSVHGHGLHVDGSIDGGPQQVIPPNTSWEIEIPVQQQAGTSWYHPHLMGKTARHVYTGLAGLYIIEDDNSKALDIPKNYGVNDIPLIVQDRSFTKGKMNPYQITHDGMMEGMRGDTLVINGTINPYYDVPKGWVRLRLLNGSNARFYRFYLSSNAPFYKIATEGGFLNKPVVIESLSMAPGERNEIMIDMSNTKNVNLMAELLPADPEDNFFFMSNPKANVVELRTDATLPSQGKLPEKINDIIYFTSADVSKAVKRNFHLDMDDGENNTMVTNDMNSMFSINGKSMDMTSIDERVKKGELELWRITADMMPHPFHMHGVSFLLMTHNGKPPAEADRGWKDTVVVTEEPTEVLMRFNHIADDKTPYMYHCHILEHEDGGMMGQFTVQ